MENTMLEAYEKRQAKKEETAATPLERYEARRMAAVIPPVTSTGAIYPQKNVYEDVYARRKEVTITNARNRYTDYENNKKRIADIDGTLRQKGVATTSRFRAFGPDGAEIDRMRDEKERLEAAVRAYERGDYQKDRFFLEYAQNADYEEKSANRSFKNATKEQYDEFDAKAYGGHVGYYDGSPTQKVEGMFPTSVSPEQAMRQMGTELAINDPLGFYLNAQGNSAAEGENSYYSPANQIAGAAYNDVLLKGDKGRWGNLTEDEIQMYYYLLNTKGKDSAMSFLTGMEHMLGDRETGKTKEYAKNASAGERVFHNAFSIPANAVGNVVAFADEAASFMRGEEPDFNNRAHELKNMAAATRETTAQKINESTGNKTFLGLSWGDVYQGLMSAADSAATAAVFGTTGAPIVLGMGAATTEAKELYEKGATDGQIVSGSLMAGALELLFEKVSLGYFFDDVLQNPAKSVPQFLMKTLGMAGVEASEEFCTTLGNYIADAKVRGSASDWRDKIEKQKAAGKSTGAAFWESLKEIGGEALHAAAIGAISGAGMGAVGNAVRNFDIDNTETAMFSFSETDREQLQSSERTIIKILSEEFDNIPVQSVFIVKSDSRVEDYSRKSEYIADIFKKQGNIAINPQIGTVELNKNGAVKTTMHTRGADKLAAAVAIKSVIENGKIIKTTENYKGTRTTRHVLAARGYIDGKPTYMGVVVKSYPTQTFNAKFYLHEVFVIKQKETGSPTTAASHEGEKTTSDPVSNNRVAQEPPVVNTQSMQEGEEYSQNALLPEDQFTGDALTPEAQARWMGEETAQKGDSFATPGDTVTDPVMQGGPVAGAVAPASDTQVLERALQSTAQGKPVSRSADVDGIINELGEDVALRRMWNATQYNRPTGMVEVDGRTVDANAYIDAYEQTLPDDPAALQEVIRRLDAERTNELTRMMNEGTLEDYRPGGLKLDLQLFAARRKWDLVQLEPGEDGKKARQFYEKRLRGTDENHSDELVALLAGRDETYNPIANQKTLNRAKDKLDGEKYQRRLIQRLNRYNPHDLFNAVDAAAAQVLINKAINDGEYIAAMDLISGLSRKGTELGRAVQAFSMMARLTPESTLKAAVRTIKAEADYVIGEGASDGLDILAEDMADAIADRESAARRERGTATESTASVPSSGEGQNGGTTGAVWDGTVGEGASSMEGASREQIVDALVDDLSATDGIYLTREDIAGSLESIIQEATDVPEQVKRYVLKKLRKDDGGLAQRLYEMHRKGHLNAESTRRAMEQALELPTLTETDVKTLVEMANRVQELSEDPVAQADAMDDIYDFLGAKMTVSNLDWLQAWRKFGMLANVKTHMRNTVSNAAYVGIRKMDDLVAMGMERMLRVAPEKRAAHLGWSHTEHGQSIMPALEKKAQEAVLEMQKRGAKYETGSGQLKQHRKFFGKGKVGEALNKANRWNSAMLEKEDMIFFRPAYIDALGQMMTARGETEITPQLHERAMQRALEATFRADNAISDVLGRLKAFQNETGAGKRLFGHGVDVVIPFHKTPANIVSQTVLHSPVGLVKGAFDIYNAVKGKGSVEVATAINTFSKGVTGTALLIIGLMLGRAGLFNTEFGKTEKERAADELAGRQENALVFGDVSISLDWLQPAASPLIVGASIGQRLQEDGIGLETVFGAVMDGTDSLFEMSMLQSLYDILGGYDAGASATAASVLENVVSQSIPTVVGQAARAIDPVQRKTAGETDAETLLNQVLAKIPGLTYLLDPELDVWGNEVYRTGKPGTGTAVLNALQQIALPSNVKVGTGKGDYISQEILRLYKEQGSGAIPTAISRDDARDKGIDWVAANRQLGGINRSAVADFINDTWPYTVQVEENGHRRNVTKFYSEMTDDERRRVLSRIYGDSKRTVIEPEEDTATADDVYFYNILGR